MKIQKRDLKNSKVLQVNTDVTLLPKVMKVNSDKSENIVQVISSLAGMQIHTKAKRTTSSSY